MAASSALVPIIVAVIGVVGAIVPIYINISALSKPNVSIRIVDYNSTGSVFRIEKLNWQSMYRSN